VFAEVDLQNVQQPGIPVLLGHRCTLVTLAGRPRRTAEALVDILGHCTLQALVGRVARRCTEDLVPVGVSALRGIPEALVGTFAHCTSVARRTLPTEYHHNR